jgi:hypothetical protein
MPENRGKYLEQTKDGDEGEERKDRKNDEGWFGVKSRYARGGVYRSGSSEA